MAYDHKKYMKEYHKRNHVKTLKYAKEYHRKHKSESRFRAKVMIARFKYPGAITISDLQDLYEQNIKEFGVLTCYLCLEKITFGEDSLDHKVPKSKGGTNEYSNLAIAHLTCNNRKHSKLPEEYLNEKN